MSVLSQVVELTTTRQAISMSHGDGRGSGSSSPPRPRVAQWIAALAGLLASGSAFSQNLPPATIGSSSTSQYYYSATGKNGSNGSDSNYDLFSGNCSPGDGGAGESPSIINYIDYLYDPNGGWVSALVAKSPGGNGSCGYWSQSLSANLIYRF